MTVTPLAHRDTNTCTVLSSSSIFNRGEEVEMRNLGFGQLVHRCIHFVSSDWGQGLLGSGQPHTVRLFYLGNESNM